MTRSRFVALLFLFVALPFAACMPPPTEHPEVPHYRFEGDLQCSQCDLAALSTPGATLRVLLLRNSSEPGEDIIMFQEDYPVDEATERSLEFQFASDRLGTAGNVWIEVSYVRADDGVEASAKQRFVRPVAMPEINAFELTLNPPSSTVDPLDAMIHDKLD